MALAVAELSNILQILGCTDGPLPSEAEKILLRHFAHYFELGQRSNQPMIVELQAEIAERDQKIRAVGEELRERSREVVALKRKLRSLEG